MSGVFFRGRTAATPTAGPPTDHIALQQLLTAAGDGVGMQAQKIAEQSIATMAEPDGFQSGEQAALLFVEQSIEQEDGGL